MANQIERQFENPARPAKPHGVDRAGGGRDDADHSLQASDSGVGESQDNLDAATVLAEVIVQENRLVQSYEKLIQTGSSSPQLVLTDQLETIRGGLHLLNSLRTARGR